MIAHDKTDGYDCSVYCALLENGIVVLINTALDWSKGIIDQLPLYVTLLA